MLRPAFIRRVASRIERLDQETLRDFVRTLAEERDFFQIIFDSMTEGVLLTDQAGIVQYANNTASVLLARLPEAVCGQPVLDCIDSIDFYNIVRAAVFENERVRNREISLYIPSDRILNVNIFPLVRAEKVHGYVIIFMDITREKLEQQRLRQVESIAALSSLSAGVAHEIKNPLGAIDIHLQLMQRALEDGDSERMRRDAGHYLAVLRDEVARLNAIVVDFLSAVRPLKVRPEAVLPEVLIKDLADFVRPAIAASGIEFEVLVSPGLPSVLVDPGLLRQALLNLLKNAQEATPQGGSIRLGVARTRDWLVFSVADSGCGIAKDRLHTIFEPYNTTKASGTGLGLTIVYRIVREHGGDIQVDSVPGKGSRFTIQLPLVGRGVHLLACPVKNDAEPGKK